MRSLTCMFLLFTIFPVIAVSPAQQASTTAVSNLIAASWSCRSVRVCPPRQLEYVRRYRQQDSGAPLWLETQNVTPDQAGHYTVLLGSTRADGISADLFRSNAGSACRCKDRRSGQECC